MKYRQTILILILFIALFFCEEAYSHGGGFIFYDISALGISHDLTVDKDETDFVPTLSYNFGFIGLISMVGTIDIGYQVDRSRLYTKIGTEIYFIFVGLEGGYLNSIKTRDDDYTAAAAHGAFLGITLGIPIPDEMVVKCAFGGNFYFQNQPIAFYFNFSLLFNFLGHRLK